METAVAAKRQFSNICTVSLLVGSEKTRFDVHQGHLCNASTFFNAAFTSQFKERSEKTIDLLEDDVDTVDLFVQWLYKQQCDPFTRPIDDNGEYQMQPMRLMVFADKYDIPSLKRYMFTKLITHFKQARSRVLSADVVTYVYNNTCSGSGIRRLIIDWMVTYAKREWFRTPYTRGWLLQNPEIAVDLVAAFSAIPDTNHVPEQLSSGLSEYYMGTKVEDNGDSSTEKSACTLAGRWMCT